MNFLIVDDSDFSRRVVRNCLENLGHRVTEAPDGSAALERYVLEKPDFVFLDLVMPGLSGFDALAHFRHIDPQARVIVCTADIQNFSRERVREIGAVGLINKPVNVDQLSAKLNTILSGGDPW